MFGMPVVLFLEHEAFSPEALTKLSAAFNVVYCDIDNLDKIVGKNNVVGIFVRLRSYIDDTVFNHLPNLKFVISPTTGHNHLDLEAMRRRAIRVVSLKGETVFLDSVTATAELTWGLILSLTRRIPQALNHVASGGWNRDAFRGVDLSGKTLGIVGYGRLGRIIEDYARAFRMNVLINDIAPRDPVFGKAVALDHLLTESDIVTVHVDINPSSVNMFGDAQFRNMKRSAYFINTSRGELIDEDALIRALKKGSIAAAATDVIRDEQTGRANSPLINACAALQGRLLVTPHIAGASWDSMSKTEDFIISKVLNEWSNDANL
jgi:D-3-phosphoglycerate dehydrogenase